MSDARMVRRENVMMEDATIISLESYHVGVSDETGGMMVGTLMYM
jgi:hypothetical protein